jgi:hypothetical protein
MSDDGHQERARAARQQGGAVPGGTGRAAKLARERAERQADLLVALVGDLHARDPDSAAFVEERGVEWLARELRLAPGDGERWSAERVAELAALVRARVEAALAPVRRIDRRPAVRVPPAPNAVARALAEAAAAGCAPWVDLGVAAGAGRELWDEPCESWVELPPALPHGEFLALTVAGDSMTPLLHSGDVVLVKLGAEAARGAIVVARRPDDGYVVKRVGRVGATSIELESLNPAFAPVVVERRSDAVLGSVVLRWCGHGTGAST